MKGIGTKKPILQSFRLLITSILMKGSVRVEPTFRRDESGFGNNPRKGAKQGQQFREGEQIREMLWLFKEFLSFSRERRQTALQGNEQCCQLQPRDRSITLPLPRNQLTKQSLQVFISTLCKEVWSRAFFYFSNQQLSYDNIKIYSSEQILKNLVRLSERFHLSPADFETINLHLQRRLLDYQLAKYPITLPQEVNRGLVSAVREVDYSDQPENDYLSSSGVVFRLRDSGEYNDLIMQVVNEVGGRVDQKAGSASLYSHFQQKMERLYAHALQEELIRGQQGVEEGLASDNAEGGRLGRQLQRLRAEARQKHKLKVQQYTTYCVGRKLPESFRPFSPEQIGSHHLRIDSPQLLRLLTKWCEQLQNKFTTPGYFQHYVQTLRLQNGKFLVLLLNEVREELDQLMGEQYRHIRHQLAELYKNNNFLQAELLSRQLSAPLHSQIEHYEGIAAGYSSAVLSNLHSYILAYLNRLIHGLLTVADKFAKHPISNHFERPSNINLITFQIDDLIRSRFSSGEKEVLKIYNEVMKVCESKNCRLIKVNNRLRKSTHDLIVTLMYKEVICEIQLMVVNAKDKHSEHSNLFHHYLYELKRSIFGPITELCSIWKGLDGRFAVYQKDFWLGGQPTSSEAHKCTVRGEFQSYYRPFICSRCNSHYHHNNFIRHHLKCNNCQYWLCARCQLQESDCRSLIAAAYKQQEVVSHCNRVRKGGCLPEYGICIFIQSQEIRVEPFRKHQGKRRSVIIGVRDRNLYEIADVSGEEAKVKFKNSYLVFELAEGCGRQLIRIEDQSIAQFLLAQQLRQAYRSNQEKLCLNYQALSDQQFSQLCKVGLPAQRLSLKRLQVIGNRLQTVSHISSAFPGLRSLELAKNSVAQYTQIIHLEGLEELGLNQNRLRAIPPEIWGLWNLKELSCCENQLKELPEELSRLHKLKILRLAGNRLQEIPKCITKLFYLSELDLRRNMIQQLPASLGFLNELQVLDLEQNRIVEVHSDISKLEKLQILGLGHNELTQFPLALTLLTSLQRCKLEFNKIVEVPASINRPHTLTHLDMSSNRLLELPRIDGLASLVHLQISHNMLEELADFAPSPLKILKCSHNKLKTLPSLEGLSFLEQLQAYDNALTSLPMSISKLRQLQLLNLQNNQLTALPELRLESLKQLSVAQNKLGSFSNMDLINAEEIDLSNNCIASFTLNLLPCLKRLLLHHNLLPALELRNYPKLRYLQAGTNRLTEFPGIEQKNHLKALNLEHNLISSIPKQCRGLRSVTQLNLSYNQIKTISSDIQYLINLKDRSLQLSFNPIEKAESLEFLLKKCTLQTLEQVDPSGKLQKKKQRVPEELFSPQKSVLIEQRQGRIV